VIVALGDGPTGRCAQPSLIPVSAMNFCLQCRRAVLANREVSSASEGEGQEGKLLQKPKPSHGEIASEIDSYIEEEEAKLQKPKPSYKKTKQQKLQEEQKKPQEPPSTSLTTRVK
jgi:hypothetical protein